MIKLLTYLRPYWRESILAPLLKLLETLMDLAVPLVVAHVINVGITSGLQDVILRDVIVLIGLAAAGWVISISGQWMAAQASVGFATELRQSLFNHIQRFSYRELDRFGAETLITRMTSDINLVETGLNLTLRLVLRSPFIVFGAMIAAFRIDVFCAQIFVVAVPLLGLLCFIIMYASDPILTRVQQGLDELLHTSRESLNGARVIRAFAKEQQIIDEFEEKNARITRMNELAGSLTSLVNPLSFLIVNSATIFLIHRGALSVELGRLMQGDVVALYNYMAQIVVELIKLASLIITLSRSFACAKRVQAVLDVAPSMSYPAEPASASELAADVDKNVQAAPTAGLFVAEAAAAGEAEAASEEAVRMSEVGFSYAKGAEEALSNISFVAKRGETIGVIGATGSGKSTLVQLIGRFYDVCGGTVAVNGRDVRSYAQGELTKKIGVVPQKAVLFEGSIRDNLRMGKEDASDAELLAALEVAQAKELVLGKEGQLDALVEQGGRNFSGGQRQRLTIARALVSEPEILILDDSASALDYATELALRRALAALPKAATVFIVSQRTASVREADRILVLDDGTLAGCGSHDELMANCAVYQEIYYSQFPEERPV